MGELLLIAASIAASDPVIVRIDDPAAIGALPRVESLGGPFYRIRGAAAAELRGRPGVRWAHRERRRRILLDQADPFEPLQWHLHSDGSLAEIWPRILDGADINAPEAWAMSTGDPSVVVAVLDGGIPPDHPDLPAGSRVAGWDYVDRDDDPSPVGTGSLSSHGTAVAGVILGARNGRGVVGVCPACRLMPARVLAPDSTARDGDLIAAILFAAERADVLNASWSFDPHAYVSPAIYDAIRWAATEGRGGRGAVLVFSAGNRSSRVDPYAPEAMTETITVAATDERDERAGYSNTGPAVTLAAPGGVQDEYEAGERIPRAKIVTADLEGEAGNNPQRDQSTSPGLVDDLAVTAAFTGTSAATPVVAGAAALLLSIRPELTANEVAWILTETAAKVGSQAYDASGRNDTLGHGRLDLGAAAAMARDGGYCLESPEDCGNGIDDDCDRLEDADDGDCGAAVVVPFELDVALVCVDETDCGDGYCSAADGMLDVRFCTADCDYDCPVSAACVGVAGSGRCVQACDVQADCPGGTLCTRPAPELVPPGREIVSVCLPYCLADRHCRSTSCLDGGCGGPVRERTIVLPPPEGGCDCASANAAPIGLALLLFCRRRRSR
jgi:subtilisin family serine protease